MVSKSVKKRLECQKGIVGRNPGEEKIYIPSAAPQRYRIVGDNSGHKYFIKVEDEEAFYAWVESYEAYENVGYEGPDFNENRIDGCFTFTDPRCE